MNMPIKIWVPILCVILSCVIGWGAWATVSMSNALPRTTFEEHCRAQEAKFDRMQTEISSKRDKLRDTILELHRGDKHAQPETERD